MVEWNGLCDIGVNQHTHGMESVLTVKASLSNSYNTNTIRTETIVQISEVSLFLEENNMYSYEIGTQSSVLIKQGVLISEVSFKRGSTVAEYRRGHTPLGLPQGPVCHNQT